VADAFSGNQVLDHLNDVMREFIRRQEMVFIATADAVGD
jgi:predicted pyridoxine 5'-phosphate oxidase superfamily flavin-nucleotide-binding protein